MRPFLENTVLYYCGYEGSGESILEVSGFNFCAGHLYCRCEYSFVGPFSLKKSRPDLAALIKAYGMYDVFQYALFCWILLSYIFTSNSILG